LSAAALKLAVATILKRVNPTGEAATTGRMREMGPGAEIEP
jgi:hypothetical protein